MELIDIALFIIPNAVSFPGTTVPLHVFEQRYRALIKESARRGHRVAVCHARKQISAPKKQQTQAEMLNSNQATYEPHRIFAAGFVEILDITEDGRLVVEIRMDGRYELIEEAQTLPYRIARCRRYADEPEFSQADRSKASECRTSVDAALARISAANGDDLRKTLSSVAWVEQSLEDYSFRIFEFIRFDPDVMQTVLEMRSPLARLEFVAKVLNAQPI